MKPVIEVNGISKSYIINHKDRASYSTIKDDFSHLLSSPFSKKEETDEKFWALKNISFEVMPGEIFGVVGRNGSGKSTLLKILSRVVDPTEGTIKLNGKTASLLEVGTGFHPELTGRENIYFNGSMLGMSRKEIQRKFNEIVEFSEVEKFIDTPVKFYSSGMYVRLAFSVAVHLESDILILDEVLAVGDAAFQKKSLQKILSAVGGGRTVLFVSHSMGSVQQLCNRGLLLDGGKIDFIGNIGDLVEKYIAQVNDMTTYDNGVGWTWHKGKEKFDDIFVPQEIFITDEDGKVVEDGVMNNKTHYFNIIADMKEEDSNLTIGYAVTNEEGRMLYFSYQTDGAKKNNIVPKGKVHLKSPIPKHLLNAGLYKLSLIGGIHNVRWMFEPGAPAPSVKYSIVGGLSESDFWRNPRDGYMAPVISWEVKKI